MFESRLLEPRHQCREVVFDLERNMRPSRRAVVRILAQVDLLTVLTLEPPGLTRKLVCHLWGRGHPPVAEDLQKEYLFSLRPPKGHPEVDMMQAQHVGSLQAARGTSVKHHPMRSTARNRASHCPGDPDTLWA